MTVDQGKHGIDSRTCPPHQVQVACAKADPCRGCPSLTGMARRLLSIAQDSPEIRSDLGGYDESHARIRARLVVAVLALVAAGCSMRQEPDLVRPYAPVAQQPKTVLLIVIPGIMGSRLIRTDTKQELWPGPFTGLLLGHDFADIALPIPGGEQIPGSPRTATLESGGFFSRARRRGFLRSNHLDLIRRSWLYLRVDRENHRDYELRAVQLGLA